MSAASSSSSVVKRGHDPYAEAQSFYQDKLQKNGSMSRYATFMAAIHSAKGEQEQADAYYRQALVTAPNNIMVRNDFAIHSASYDNHAKRLDGIKEMKKAILMVPENGVIHKNTGALYARVGHYNDALHHAQHAEQLAPNDAMNHRNLAKLHAVLGDTHSALTHNLTAIELDGNNTGPGSISAYRAAAVQIISKGGSQEDALTLMRTARVKEGKKFELSTTTRTNEILDKLHKQQRDRILLAKLAKDKELELKKQSVGEWQKILDRIQG